MSNQDFSYFNSKNEVGMGRNDNPVDPTSRITLNAVVNMNAYRDAVKCKDPYYENCDRSNDAFYIEQGDPMFALRSDTSREIRVLSSLNGVFRKGVDIEEQMDQVIFIGFANSQYVVDSSDPGPLGISVTVGGRKTISVSRTQPPRAGDYLMWRLRLAEEKSDWSDEGKITLEIVRYDPLIHKMNATYLFEVAKRTSKIRMNKKKKSKDIEELKNKKTNESYEQLKKVILSIAMLGAHALAVQGLVVPDMEALYSPEKRRENSFKYLKGNVPNNLFMRGIASSLGLLSDGVMSQQQLPDFVTSFDERNPRDGKTEFTSTALQTMTDIIFFKPNAFHGWLDAPYRDDAQRSGGMDGEMDSIQASCIKNLFGTINECDFRIKRRIIGETLSPENPGTVDAHIGTYGGVLV
jgi:hypothetical protein